MRAGTGSGRKVTHRATLASTGKAHAAADPAAERLTESATKGSLSVYLSASLFSPAERSLNTKIGSALEQLGARVFLPQDFAGSVPANGRDYRRVYERNLRAIERASLVVAVVDGSDVDSGVAWELGYAAARGVPTLCFRTDFRRAENRGVNIMVEFGSTRMVYFTGFRSTLADVIARVVAEVTDYLGSALRDASLR